MASNGVLGSEDDWIKLHRKMLKSAVVQDANVFVVWIHLLLRANWEERQMLSGVVLKPGQLILGQAKFAKEIGLSRRNVRTALKILENLGNVTSTSTNKGTHITICNWLTYQLDDRQSDQQSDQQVTSSRPASDQQVTNGRPQNKKGRSKEVKKERKEEGKKGRNKTATSSQCDEVIAHYRTYHPKARPGEKERKLIRARLAEGYSVEDITLAIDGCHVSPFHCGENERGKKYQSLELIVRDSKHTAEFMEAWQTRDDVVMSEKERRGRRASSNVIRRMGVLFNGTTN